MSSVKEIRLPKTTISVVDDSTKQVVWDMINKRLSVIIPDVAQVAATGGQEHLPIMQPGNKSSFWGPI